jgi:hypothetical protein
VSEYSFTRKALSFQSRFTAKNSALVTTAVVMMETSNNAKEPSLPNGRRPSLPVIDLGSLLGPSFSPRTGDENKSEEVLLQHGHGIASVENESQHSLQQSLESEGKIQFEGPVADAITSNAELQQVVSIDSETSHPFLSIKKRKRDAALCNNNNVVSLQSEIMPINEAADSLGTHDFVQGLFSQPSKEATATRTRMPERPKRKVKLAGRDVRLVQKVAALMVKKMSARSKSRTLASPSKKRKIKASLPPSRASPESNQSQVLSPSPLQDASSGQSRGGNAPAATQRLFSPMPQHPKARVPLATRPATQKSMSPLPPPMISTTKPPNSLSIPTRAAPGARPAHQSRESCYPMQGTPYGTFPAGNVSFVAKGTYVSGQHQSPLTMQHGPPVPYYNPYPMPFGGPPPYNVYYALYYPPPLYHYPHVQPYPSRPGAPAKKMKRSKPKSKAKKKRSPTKKKAPKSNSKAEPIDPVNRKEMTEMIRAVNATSGGKNDKAAEKAAAISRGVTMRPSGNWVGFSAVFVLFLAAC